jgi:hypothetical protein
VTPVTLLAFGFGNLAMLGWLAAAAAPLLIHLWSRHRFREAPWAAMQFLLEAIRKNARRMQLQQWLLLALRTLIIALVVLAVAEPYGEQLAASGAPAPAHRILVIDGSLSMAHQDGNISRFERVKELAADLVRNSRAGDKFSVILMSSQSRLVVGRETAEPAIVAAQIESLSQLHTTANLAGALKLVEEALANSRDDNNSTHRDELYFFTDLQRATWRDAGSSKQSDRSGEPTRESPTRSAAAEQLAALAERIPVAIVDLGDAEAANLAISQIACLEPFVTADREIAFQATLRQFDSEPHSGCSVELLVDDVPVGEQTVHVPANAETTVRFTHRFASPGRHTLTIRAQTDQLAVDNSRSLVVPVRDAVRVVCVAGREGAARYVADALDPNPAAPSAIRPVVIAESDFADVTLSEFDCVFLCNVAQLAASDAQRLSRYVAGGGGIVILLGDRVIPASYNAFAMASAATSNADTERAGSSSTPAAPDSATPARTPSPAFLPARIGELITEPQFGLDPLDYRHPIVAPFRGRERAGLLTTPVTRYYHLDTSRSPRGAEVAAATRRGDPFIVAAPLGLGRSVLVATDGSLSSIDPTTGEPWTTWPTWPSFLPIVRELVSYAASGQNQAWQQLVGSSITGTLADEAANVSTSAGPRDRVQIVRPDGRAAPVAWQSVGGTWQWTYNNTDLSGVYTLRGLSQERSKQFAVNVDPVESDLVKLDSKELPPNVLVRATAENGATHGAQRLVTQASWSARLLWLAVALMLVESFLAWQFGRGTA